MAIPTLEEIMKYKGKTYAGTMNKAFTRPEITSGTNLTNPNLNSGLAGGIAGGVMSIAPMTPKSPPVQKPIPTPKFYQNPFKNPLEKTLGTTTNAAGQIMPKYTPPVNPDADLTPQEVLKKYQAIADDNSIENRNALLKQGYNSLNNIARQQVAVPLLRPKINGAVNQDEIAQAMQLRDELARQTKLGAGSLAFVNSASFGQLKNPAFGDKFAPEAVAEQRAAINRAEQAQPVASGVGRFAGEAIKYGATAGLVNEIPAVQALTKGKLPARLIAGRLADIVPDVVTASQETNNAADFAKNLTINQVTGLAFDGALEGIGAAARGIVKKVTSNQPISNVEVSQLRNAISDGIKKGDIDTDAVARSIANQEVTPTTTPQLPRTVPAQSRAASNVAPQPVPRAAEIAQPVRATSTEAPTFGKNTVGAAESAFPHEQKISKFRSNTIEKSPMFTQAEKELLNPSDYQYDVIGEKQSLAEAKQRLEVDFAGEVADLPNKSGFNGTDTDTAMGILEAYLQEARKTGDYSKVKEWSKMVQQKGTEGGQLIQAFAKYSRTPEGAVVKGQQVVDAVEREIKKTNPRKVKVVDTETESVVEAIQETEAEAAQEAAKEIVNTVETANTNLATPKQKRFFLRLKCWPKKSNLPQSRIPQKRRTL